MSKINREEYATLKRMQKKGHKFIARTKEGHVIVFTAYHGKSENRWLVTTNRDDYKYESLYNSDEIFLFIGWEDEEPYSIAELIEEYEYWQRIAQNPTVANLVGYRKESEETEVKSKQELIEKWESAIGAAEFYGKGKEERLISYMKDFVSDLNQLDEPEPKNITLQDVTDKLWKLPLNNRKLWLARLNDEFQEDYIVPLGLKTTDGEEQYLTYNGSYFASRRNKYLQQTFDTLEEIPEFYRDLAERVL